MIDNLLLFSLKYVKVEAIMIAYDIFLGILTVISQHKIKTSSNNSFIQKFHYFYQAILLDPNTGSFCSPSEIRSMTEELFEAEKKWLPQFN
ncbi:MAG: hypothetical protein ACW99Q_05110 [Candidatus Kariarchaeaceae archaeon]|jgi:hypothetical protein